MKQLSDQASVAKICKLFCKSIGVKCKATSDSFSMGDSVSLTINNQSPIVMKKLHDELDQYQYGHFDGMTDMYEYSARRDDIPQTKYLSISNRFDDDLRQQAWAFVKDDGAPELLADADMYRMGNEWANDTVFRTLNGNHQLADKFWDSIKPTDTTVKSAAHIEQHVHTKKGFTMHLVIMSDHLGTEQFNAIRDQARCAGGWYSRKWGKTPCGFAFEDQQKAELFLATLVPA